VCGWVGGWVGVGVGVCMCVCVCVCGVRSLEGLWLYCQTTNVHCAFSPTSHPHPTHNLPPTPHIHTPHTYTHTHTHNAHTHTHTFTCAHMAAPPPPPNPITVTVLNSTAVTVTWAVITTPAVDSYIIEYRLVGTTSWTRVPSQGPPLIIPSRRASGSCSHVPNL